MNTSPTVSLVRTVQKLLLKIKIAFFEDNGDVQGRLSPIQSLKQLLRLDSMLCFCNCSTVVKTPWYFAMSACVPVSPISRNSVKVKKENCTFLCFVALQFIFSYHMVHSVSGVI